LDQFVVRAQAGERGAFAALVEHYWAPLSRWLLQLARRLELAEDLAQDAFLRAWEGIGRLHPPSGFRAWLFRIALNRFLDERRRPRAAAICEEPIDYREAGEPLANLLEAEGLDVLRRSLAGLAEPYRAPFLLRTQEGFSFAEIALVLGVAEETARWRVAKARHLLLDAMRDYLETDKA
jgi:RNA polymerase sigma-70 factor (ECF subfamily)